MNLKIVWLVVVGGCAVGFGSGLIVGRQYPAHHYERFGTTSYLLDPTTGKVCDPMFKATSPSVYDQQAATAGPFPPPPPGFTIVQIKDAYPPACGK
jgi:hypothetical protein